jgi:hypothetical protein
LPPQPTVPPGCLISIIDRTWTASDQCGNVSSGVQTITVRDTTSPVIICPTNVTLECPAEPTTNVTGAATATDGCGSVSITFSDSISSTCGGAEVVQRTWTATDQCGNSTNAVQTITIVDSTPPVIAQQPEVILHEGDPLTLTNPSVSDACSDFSIWLRSLTTNAWFGGAYSINCTWEAVDTCSNVAQMSRTFWVLPRLSDKPRLAIGMHDRLLSLGWPAEPSGWWLESTLSLSRPHWQPVGITPTFTNGIYLVTLNPTGAAQWFRLASGNPPLSIFRSQPDKLMLAWPSLATGYTVLRATNCWQRPWSPDTAIILITNGMNYIEFPSTNGSSYFKLVKPAP